MRQMSVTATVGPVQRREKDITRRLGWDNLKVGELIQLVEKAQGPYHFQSYFSKHFLNLATKSARTVHRWS